MAAAATASDPFVGTVIADRYRVVGLLGKGAMGAVYEAEHLAIGLRVAIKRLTADSSGDPEVFTRFRREAEVIAGFQHPNIVGVLDWVTLDDGSPCIVMEHLKGEDLASRIASRGALGWNELARIADEVLSALSVAHQAGIVHRDLKPQNIFLARDDEGREAAKLLDFGVSKIHACGTFATSANQMIGTPAYMAPEQAGGRSQQVEASTDLWAMGVVLFEMATARLPFDGDSVPAILYQICHEPPARLRELRHDAPVAFDAALRACMTRDLQTRTQSAAALRKQLRQALGQLAPAALRAPVPVGPAGEDKIITGNLTTLAAPVPAVDAIAATQRSGATTKPGVTTTLSASSGAIPVGPAPRKRGASVGPLLLCLGLGAVAVFMALDPLANRLEREQSAAQPVEMAAPATVPPAKTTTPGPPAATFTVVIESDPSGANVFDDKNRYMGITPLTYESDGQFKTLEVTVRKPGYQDKEATVDIRSGDSAKLVLTPEPTRRRAARGPRKPKPETIAPPPAEEKPAKIVKKRPRGPYVEDL